MDLIYTDKNGIDVDMLPTYKLDMAYGRDENNFEVTIAIEDHCCEPECRIYMGDSDDGKNQWTEIGGIIDAIKLNTESGDITYSGRTWHGIMEGKVLCPDAGQDYLILSGEANTVLDMLIKRMNLEDMFEVSDVDSGIIITSYQMDRYVAGYTGIRKMLKNANAKLKMHYKEGKVEMQAIPLIDYSKDEEWDSTQISATVSKNDIPVNHIICLGKGELKERKVIHLYQDSRGNISKTQSYFGIQEITDIYDNANTESEQELEEKGREKLEDAYAAANSMEVTFKSNEIYDIGDYVGTTERYTGIKIREEITKKIIKVNSNGISVECQIGE